LRGAACGPCLAIASVEQLNAMHTRPKRLGQQSRNRRIQDEEGPTLIFGMHAVEAALRNRRRAIHAVLLTDNAQHRLEMALAERGIKPQRIAPRDLDKRLGPDTVHQGALIEAEPLPEPALEDVAAGGAASGPLVVFDHVTDPHNVGAALRSAAAFGAAGLVMTRRHSPPLGGVLAKSASGALEWVPVVLVPNLARALQQLRELGYTRLGLDGGAEHLLEDESLAGPVAFVLGAEGKGLRQLTRQTCDRLCRIATPGPISSLNVSNAAAVALHLAALRRRTAPPR
jgi:23S rRNA (guanosine2251-2'-O)-methyltransferase